MKTVNDLIKELQNLKSELREKPVVVNAENGMQFSAEVKLYADNQFDLIDGEISKIVIGY